MPPKFISNISSIIMSDTNGNKICDLGKPTEFCSIDYEIPMSIKYQPELEITLSNCEISKELEEQLLGKKDLWKNKLKLMANKIVKVQKQKHRQKRINKKWLKKYGYIERVVPFEIDLEDCSITQDELDRNCFELNGKVIVN